MSYQRSVKDESLGLISVSRLKVPRLSVSSRSRTKFWNLSRLGLASDENFWDSFVSVSSRLLQFYSVSSQSRPDMDEYFLNKIKPNLQSVSLIKD